MRHDLFSDFIEPTFSFFYFLVEITFCGIGL